MRGEGMIGADMQNAHRAQDLHTMIDTVLQGFVKLQKDWVSMGPILQWQAI